ncbi:MAG TPA: ABC transporter substrate-binding protein [Thermoanaerobaculia bacterium]|jgi:peptide/nickel transport system substrate-binding protein|nr:ABC transporter substrate-binding protein [Thermoanaerobaculia bacterium]
MKGLSRFLAAFAVLAVVACGRSGETPTTRTTLVRHLLGDPASLDPTTSTEDPGLLVDEMLYRPLVGIDAHRKPVPALAASWTESPDGLTFEFHLDPRYTWETGQPVTSDDVRFTVERMRDPKLPAPTWRAAYEDLVAIETPDPATVRLRFGKPYAERMYAFTLQIVSAAAFGRAKDAAETARHPVGTGPYRLEAWESNEKVKLVRRDGAANSDGRFDEIVFRVIPDGAVRYKAGLRGELDEFRLTRDQTLTARATPAFLERFRILKAPQFVLPMLLWNCRHPFLADPRVRVALAHAWPREEAARRLYPPDGATLASGPYPPGVPENAPGLAPPSYDPAESARLLDEAGWKVGPGGIRRKGGRKASIELLQPSGQAIYGQVSEILRAAYEKVGVELEVRALEWAAYSERSQKGEFDADFYGRVFYPPNLDPYPYYDSRQWPEGGDNLGFYKNAEADRVMEAARAELDPARRLDMYRQVARLFAADPPADFLWGAEQYWAMAKRVEDVEVSPIGLFHFLPGPLGWRPRPAAQR